MLIIQVILVSSSVGTNYQLNEIPSALQSIIGCKNCCKLSKMVWQTSDAFCLGMLLYIAKFYAFTKSCVQLAPHENSKTSELWSSISFETANKLANLDGMHMCLKRRSRLVTSSSRILVYCCSGTKTSCWSTFCPC